MAKNNSNSNFYSANDALDINELAALNDDITPEFIEKLQQQVAQDANKFTGKDVLANIDDATLFEEIQNNESVETTPQINQTEVNNITPTEQVNLEPKTDKKENEKEISSAEITEKNNIKDKIEDVIKSSEPIENLTSGNIIEKPIDDNTLKQNNSLEYLDNNAKYSKYVIYIDPENTEFINSLTVKERKNLINRLLKEQDDIAITKRRLTLIQTIIKHSLIAIVTITLAIPIIYWTINASLEASINNYRRSETIFKSLYKDKGKIKQNLR